MLALGFLDERRIEAFTRIGHRRNVIRAERDRRLILRHRDPLHVLQQQRVGHVAQVGQAQAEAPCACITNSARSGRPADSNASITCEDESPADFAVVVCDPSDESEGRGVGRPE